MLRTLKILEMIWLAIGIFSLIIAIYQVSLTGWEQAKWFFAGTGIAASFFTYRRSQRKRFEKESDQNNRSSL